MVADIFEKDYFDKRRQNEGIMNVEKGRSSNFLNLKRKAKIQKKKDRQELKDLKKDQNMDFDDISEDVPIEEGVCDIAKPVRTVGWRQDFLNSSVSGFSGGFVVFVFLLRYAMGFHWKSVAFWGGVLMILVLALIVYLLLSLVLKILDR